METRFLLAAALGLVGAAAAVPVALAQLDFGGILNFADIHAGDTPSGVVAWVAASGFLTTAFAALALGGAALAFFGSRAAGRTLAAAALGGIVSATILWVVPGLALGAAAALTRRSSPAEEVIPAAAG